MVTMVHLVRILLSCLLLFAWTLTCPLQAFSNDRVAVFVSIAPQKYFVQQIGRELVDVQIMVQRGGDPHTYEPKPRQMAAISRAKLYFAIGIDFESTWLGKIAATNPKMKVVHTDRDIEKIPMAVHPYEESAPQKNSGHHDENGQPAYENHQREHSGLDPHIWLSPPLVMRQARSILSALQEIDPVHHSSYQAYYSAFIAAIVDLDRALKAIFIGKRGLQFMVFHPSWGYFARTYGLKQIPIEIEGKHPKPARLKELIEYARDKGIRVIFVQPQFSTKSAELVAKEISGQVVFADPLAENWMAAMREVAHKFKAALR